VASLSQGRTAAAQCGLFTHKSVPVIFEPPCSYLVSTIEKKDQNLQSCGKKLKENLALMCYYLHAVYNEASSDYKEIIPIVSIDTYFDYDIHSRLIRNVQTSALFAAMNSRAVPQCMFRSLRHLPLFKIASA